MYTRKRMSFYIHYNGRIQKHPFVDERIEVCAGVRVNVKAFAQGLLPRSFFPPRGFLIIQTCPDVSVNPAVTEKPPRYHECR